MTTIPLILIKRIINILIHYNYKYISKYFFLSKSIQTYILNQFDHFKFTNIETFNSIRNRVNDQIKSIEIKGYLALNIIEKGFSGSGYFPNLKQVKIIIQSNLYPPHKPPYMRNKSFLDPPTYEIKYKSNNTRVSKPHLRNESLYTKLKKLKLSKTQTIKFSLINDILEKGTNLKSIEFSLNTTFYVPDTSDMFFGEFEDNSSVKNQNHAKEIQRFENLFVNGYCKNLKTLSMVMLNKKKKYSNQASPNYSYFKNTALPNILSSKFQNISKLCLTNLMVPSGFFKFLSTDKILKLKLVSVFLELTSSNLNEDYFLELVHYLNENQSLKQLSIKSNNLCDYGNSLSSTLKTHKSLTKLDISDNNLNLVQIFDSIIYKSPQFTKITISDMNILPYDYLIDNQQQLLSYESDFNNLQIKYKYKENFKQNKINLSLSNVVEFKNNFYKVEDDANCSFSDDIFS